MKSCIVIFPLHQVPNTVELAFLENGIAKTKGHKQVIIAPEGLMIDQSFGGLEKLEIKRFAKHYFDNIAGYNELLLSKGFYAAFKQYDFMLIHQADVYLFKEELQYWCEKDYDYIGAPWFSPNKLNRNSTYKLIQKIKLSFNKNKIYGDRDNKVGTGGLSLRKVSTALNILENVDPALLKQYIKSQGEDFNEDIFWSLEAPSILDFKIPKWEEAMRFAVEFHPAIAYKHLRDTLPFGSHEPLKNDPEFWKEFIPLI